MPNHKHTPQHSSAGLCLALFALLLTACASTPPDPALLIPADDAIGIAEDAGAQMHATLELEEAMALRSQAEALMAEGETEATVRTVEQAVMKARLAVVRSRGAQARQKLAEERATLDMLEQDLFESYGDQIDLEPQP
ncbi:MAG: DUF4398 domain-containing protein [Pseudomonadota bacterium]